MPWQPGGLARLILKHVFSVAIRPNNLAPRARSLIKDNRGHHRMRVRHFDRVGYVRVNDSDQYLLPYVVYHFQDKATVIEKS